MDDVTFLQTQLILIGGLEGEQDFAVFFSCRLQLKKKQNKTKKRNKNVSKYGKCSKYEYEF